ncbi:MAG: phosphate signaling complex protein PhoU [Thermoplasmata archaeon]|nr:phosphate signaling complex protein PhoU [Thermoplasmata archaeon]
MPERVERKAFGEGLVQLNQHTVEMAGLAQRAVRMAVDSLVHRNDDRAKEVFLLDREIYRLQRAVEGECTDLIALFAPVARDLRTVMTVLKISTDIDRIGRGARNIAEVSLELSQVKQKSPKLDKISRNADLAIHMVDQSVRAFVEGNDRTVREMGRFDDEVDTLYREIFSDVLAGLNDRTIKPEVGVRLILINRHIERIADHAVNIANRVVYLVSGEAPPPVSRMVNGESGLTGAPGLAPAPPPSEPRADAEAGSGAAPADDSPSKAATGDRKPE